MLAHKIRNRTHKIRLVVLSVALFAFAGFLQQGGIHRGRRRQALGDTGKVVKQVVFHINVRDGIETKLLAPAFAAALVPFHCLALLESTFGALSTRAPPLPF